MKILLVEDEPGLVSVIMRGLAENNIEVSVAADGATGLDMALNHAFDLLLLDLMLPGLNGIQVCKAIRESGSDLPILMLTALGSTENVVTGLDAGADDYLVKPFKFAELQARIRSLTRRNRAIAVPATVLKAGKLEIDTDARTVLRDSVPVSLTATEYRLLEFFARNPNKVLSRIQILEHVWDINFNLGTNVVDVYVNYLRKKVDNDRSVKLIHTVFGMGYLFKEAAVNENSN